MSAKKDFKSDISKKSDKMIDSHREFLDMDTDEEDFGRQGKRTIMRTTIYFNSKRGTHFLTN